MKAKPEDTSEEHMSQQVITIELRVHATPLEARIIRDAAQNAGWDKAQELHVGVAASTKIETQK